LRPAPPSGGGVTRRLLPHTVMVPALATSVMSHNNKYLKIPIDAVMSHAHLPKEEAAKRLGVGLTTLTKICKAHGISRWANVSQSAGDSAGEQDTHDGTWEQPLQQEHLLASFAAAGGRDTGLDWTVGEEVEVEREGIFFAATVVGVDSDAVACSPRRWAEGAQDDNAHWWVPRASARLFHPASARGTAAAPDSSRRGGLEGLAGGEGSSSSGIKLRLKTGATASVGAEAAREPPRKARKVEGGARYDKQSSGDESRGFPAPCRSLASMSGSDVSDWVATQGLGSQASAPPVRPPPTAATAAASCPLKHPRPAREVLTGQARAGWAAAAGRGAGRARRAGAVQPP
jgi:hypothetical protein